MTDTTITIVGNLTADVDLRFTPNGAAVANFTVASTPRRFDKQASQWVDDGTDFYDCTAWRGLAENGAEKIVKGSLYVVVGTLASRSYDDRAATPTTPERKS